MVVAATLLTVAVTAQVAAPAPEVRLYTLDGGRLDFFNMGPFSDTGEHEGEKGVMAVACFLIKHGQDWLLWDTGLGDDLANTPGKMQIGAHWTVRAPLAAQLAQLGLKPDDVRYVALSHLHADHAGNVGLFPHATFLISPLELAWAQRTPRPKGVIPAQVAAVAASTIQPVPDDLDVFGDGSVRMLRTAGHTPGHHSLLLQLAHSGTVILSGDVAHTQEGYDKALIPVEDFDRADSLASIARFKALAAHYHARVVIQHAPNVFETLPLFPAFLD